MLGALRLTAAGNAKSPQRPSQRRIPQCMALFFGKNLMHSVHVTIAAAIQLDERIRRRQWMRAGYRVALLPMAGNDPLDCLHVQRRQACDLALALALLPQRKHC